MPKDLIPDVLPKALDDLARRINEAHTVALGSARTAIEHAIECGRLLIEAKDQVEHGEWRKWVETNTTVSHRTAQLWMRYAENSEILLTNTQSIALLTFAEADKLIAAQNAKEVPKPATPKKEQQQKAQVQAALDAYDRLKASGKEPTKEAIKEEASVGVRAAGQAKAIRETEAKATAAATAAAVETATAKAAKAALSMKLDAAIRAHKRKLELEFETRVQAECKRRQEELSIPAYFQRLAEIERMLNWPRKGVMTKSEYNMIVLCLHPDALNSRTVDQMAKAFRLFTHYKLKMVDDEDERRKLASSLPRTREEVLARKKKR